MMMMMMVFFVCLLLSLLQALSMSCNENFTILPQFQALRCLRLCFVNYSSWDVLSKLLECAPNLEVLALSKVNLNFSLLVFSYLIIACHY